MVPSNRSPGKKQLLECFASDMRTGWRATSILLSGAVKSRDWSLRLACGHFTNHRCNFKRSDIKPSGHYPCWHLPHQPACCQLEGPGHCSVALWRVCSMLLEGIQPFPLLQVVMQCMKESMVNVTLLQTKAHSLLTSIPKLCEFQVRNILGLSVLLHVTSSFCMKLGSSPNAAVSILCRV